MRQLIILTIALICAVATCAQCDDSTPINLFPALVPAYPLAEGSNAPTFQACGLDGEFVDFAEIFANGQPVLLIGFSGTWEKIYPLFPWLETVDSVYNIRHFLVYTVEALPDTSCLNSFCVYDPYGLCPGALSFCQAQTIGDRRNSAERTINGYDVRAVVDNSQNEFWNKYQNLPFAAYIVKDGIICKSWKEFNPSNFGAYINSCNITGIDGGQETISPNGYGFNGVEFRPMTRAEWLKNSSKFPYFKK